MAHKAAVTYDESIDKRREYGILRSSMLFERSSFESHYVELANFVKPRRTRLFASERNRGEKKNQKIMDSTATYCLEILRSGMHTGLTSPASPWLEMGLMDPELAQYRPVKQWLREITDFLLLMFEKSNLYNILPTTYGDEGQFGTGCMGTYEDAEDMVRSYSYPVGSYALAMDQRGKISSFMRDTQFTTRQIVREFGVIPGTRNINWANISDGVKSAWDRGNYEMWWGLCNIVTPNEEYDPRKVKSQFKKFASCWFECGGVSTGEANAQSGNVGGNNKFLREMGYDEFPVFAPRWETTGEDTYGTECPGMVALGDVKQLQTGEKRSLQAVEKMVNPPTTAPTSLRSQGVNGLPGGTTYVDVSQHQQGVRSLYDMQFAIDKVELKQQGVRGRLERTYYTNLFLMMATSSDQEKTAREIAERHEEKLLSLGPVVRRNDDELLDPLVFRHLAIAFRAGRLPPPPAEVANQQLKVTYISMMHQAQKLVGVSSNERFMTNVMTVGELMPEVKAKVNGFKWVDNMADQLGINPNQIRTDEEAQAIVDQSNQMAMQAHAAEMVSQGAGAARDLSQARELAAPSR